MFVFIFYNFYQYLILFAPLKFFYCLYLILFVTHFNLPSYPERTICVVFLAKTFFTPLCKYLVVMVVVALLNIVRLVTIIY